MGNVRRMICTDIYCSTRFLGMDVRSQVLYTYCILFADDRGIVRDPDRILLYLMAGQGIKANPWDELIRYGYIDIYETDFDRYVIIVHYFWANRLPRTASNCILPKDIQLYLCADGTQHVGNPSAHGQNVIDCSADEIPDIARDLLGRKKNTGTSRNNYNNNRNPNQLKLTQHNRYPTSLDSYNTFMHQSYDMVDLEQRAERGDL